MRRFAQGLSVNKVGPKRGPEQHGVGWWAEKYKCPCEPCIKAKRAWNKGRKYKQKDRPPHRHGTTYAWDVKKCDCLICLDHKVKFIREKNRRVTERRRAKRAEEMARAKAG